jgi:hypothetical protein
VYSSQWQKLVASGKKFCVAEKPQFQEENEENLRENEHNQQNRKVDSKKRRKFLAGGCWFLTWKTWKASLHSQSLQCNWLQKFFLAQAAKVKDAKFTPRCDPVFHFRLAMRWKNFENNIAEDICMVGRIVSDVTFEIA